MTEQLTIPRGNGALPRPLGSGIFVQEMSITSLCAADSSKTVDAQRFDFDASTGKSVSRELPCDLDFLCSKIGGMFKFAASTD
jgi:hypothetical protein